MHRNRLMRSWWIVSLVLAAAFVSQAASCQNQYHDAVVIEHDFTGLVVAAQKIEIAEHAAGNIDAATHVKLETGFLKVGQAGEQVATLMAANASKPQVTAAIAQVTTALQTLLDDGTLGIKNPTTLANWKVTIAAIQAIVLNLQTFLG